MLSTEDAIYLRGMIMTKRIERIEMQIAELKSVIEKLESDVKRLTRSNKHEN